MFFLLIVLSYYDGCFHGILFLVTNDSWVRYIFLLSIWVIP